MYPLFSPKSHYRKTLRRYSGNPAAALVAREFIGRGCFHDQWYNSPKPHAWIALKHPFQERVREPSSKESVIWTPR